MISGTGCFLAGGKGFSSSRPTRSSRWTQRAGDLVTMLFLRLVMTHDDGDGDGGDGDDGGGGDVDGGD